MRIIASLFFISLFSSCILLDIIEIDLGGNDFADLSEAALNRVKPAATLDIENNFDYDGSLYEIDAPDIQKIITSKETVWLHIWRPFCSAKECQYIAPFEAKAKKLSMKLFMVSETYDFKSLDSIANRANYAYPFFVIRGNTFGHKIDKSRKVFLKALAKNQELQPTKYASDFIYKNGKLIYASNVILDSLEAVISKK